MNNGTLLILEEEEGLKVDFMEGVRYLLNESLFRLTEYQYNVWCLILDYKGVWHRRPKEIEETEGC